MRKLKIKTAVDKKNDHYNDVYLRLVKYFDEKNVLLYTRDDIQILKGKKNYFRAVAIKSAFEKGETAIEKDSYGRKCRTVYVCTQSDMHGVEDPALLPKAWLEMLVSRMKELSVMAELPASVKAFAADSVEELEVKMSIVGI